MTIEEVLREMRLYAEDDHYGPDVGGWLIAIEAAMREPVAEVFECGPQPWMKLHIAAHLLPGVDLPPGTKLYALSPDAAGGIAVLRDRLHGREVLIDKQQAEIERSHAAIRKANAQAEHFEREWYLRGDEIERLRALLAEARDDIHDEVANRYPWKNKYPQDMRRYERDMDIVRRIDAALDRKEPPQP